MFEVLMEVKQFFLNWLAEKAEVFTNNQQTSNKKWKIDNENAEQSRITDFQKEFMKLIKLV